MLFDQRTGEYCSDVEVINTVVRGMVERALMDMRGEGVGRSEEITFSLDLLLRGEGATLKTMVRSPGLALRNDRDVREICDRFREKSGWAEDRGCEFLETLILRATAATSHPPLPTYPIGTTDPSAARKTPRSVLWSATAGFQETPVYDLTRLTPGNRVEGPAIIEATDTVCPVPLGATFTLDQYRSGILALDGDHWNRTVRKENA